MSKDAPSSIDMLQRLLAFDTTSRNSNLELIKYIQSYLDEFGVKSTLVPNAEGTKANLFASIGPATEDGVVLSGHTDVVPVDGQPWTTDPWALTEKPDGNLYGRGTCDMKGFIAVALSHVPTFQQARQGAGAPRLLLRRGDRLPGRARAGRKADGQRGPPEG